MAWWLSRLAPRGRRVDRRHRHSKRSHLRVWLPIAWRQQPECFGALGCMSAQAALFWSSYHSRIRRPDEEEGRTSRSTQRAGLNGDSYASLPLSISHLSEAFTARSPARVSSVAFCENELPVICHHWLRGNVAGFHSVHDSAKTPCRNSCMMLPLRMAQFLPVSGGPLGGRVWS